MRVPVDWEQQLDTFRKQGLTNSDIARAMTQAWRLARKGKVDDPWRYTCGILWNLIDERSRLGNVL